MKHFVNFFNIEKLKNFFSWNQFKDFYQYVKAFWIDFFKEAKRGTQTHIKGIRIFLLFCIIAFFVLLGALLKFTESSTFCGLCLYGFMESLQPPPRSVYEMSL